LRPNTRYFTVHWHPVDTDRSLVGLLVSTDVANSIRVKDDDIRIHPLLDTTLCLHLWNEVLPGPGRHQAHLGQGFRHGYRAVIDGHFAGQVVGFCPHHSLSRLRRDPVEDPGLDGNHLFAPGASALHRAVIILRCPGAI
jgi:hypothetical protein